MDENTLRLVGTWAQSKVDSGEEPPWTFHKLKQLAEITLELAEGMNAAITVNADGTERHNAPVPASQITTAQSADSLPKNVVSFEAFRPVKPAPALPFPA